VRGFGVDEEEKEGHAGAAHGGERQKVDQKSQNSSGKLLQSTRMRLKSGGDPWMEERDRFFGIDCSPRKQFRGHFHAGGTRRGESQRCPME
jgi:hypothetical protein